MAARTILIVSRAFSGSSMWLLVDYILVYIKRALSRCEQPSKLVVMVLGCSGWLPGNCYLVARMFLMVAMAFFK